MLHMETSKRTSRRTCSRGRIPRCPLLSLPILSQVTAACFNQCVWVAFTYESIFQGPNWQAM